MHVKSPLTLAFCSFVFFLVGRTACLDVQFVSRYYRNIIYEDNYNKLNNEQAQLDRMPNHDMNFIPRIYESTSLINYLKDVKLRS